MFQAFSSCVFPVRDVRVFISSFPVPLLQLVDEEFDALEGFFYVLEHGILELLENVETYLHHLQVSSAWLIHSADVLKTKKHISFSYDEWRSET